MFGRTFVAISAWLLSVIPLAVSSAFLFGTISAFFARPAPLTLLMLLLVLIPTYAWVVLLILTIGWVLQRRVSPRWVKSGFSCALAVLIVLGIWEPQTLLLAVPSVLFASYLCWYHLERPSSQGELS